MEFYTAFKQHKNKILLSGYEDGVKVNKQIDLKPYLFIPTDESTPYSDIFDNPVGRMDFDSVFEAREFVQRHKDLHNFKMYGSTNYDYVWINDNFKQIKSDNTKLRIGNYDIETDTEGGYGNIDTADKAIISITMHVLSDDTVYCLGFKPYDPKQSEVLKRECPQYKVEYIQCMSEEQLLMKFVRLWKSLKLDAITGWNIDAYDHPYTIRRITRLLGEEYAKKLSPFGIINSREFEMWGKVQTRFEIYGVPTLDYMECYKKFSFKKAESYSLNYISSLVLKKTKLDYKTKYKNLANLYKQNSDMFYDYNIVDVVRVADLEERLKFIDLIFSAAHFTKTNAVDGFSTVKPHDVVIHNTLMKDNKVVPFKEISEGPHRVIAGGYVKEPIAGHHKYVISFDFTSLYPHLVMAFNISPDTFMGKLDSYDSVDTPDRIINGEFEKYRQKLIDTNVCITGKGTVFTRDFMGVFAKIMKDTFAQRKYYKDLMLKYKKEREQTHDPAEKKRLSNLIVEFDNKQMATKILANSFYGALANPHSRWFSYDIAESITISGQLASKWVSSYTNQYMNKILKNKTAKDYIVAVDTDSQYINVTDLIDKIYPNGADHDKIMDTLDKIAHDIETNAIAVALEQLYKTTNIFDKCLHMKQEAIGQAVWSSAKHYIMLVWSMEGIRYETPQIKMQGIEAVKSSTPEVCRDYMKDSLIYIVQKNRSGLKKHIDKCTEEFHSLPFDRVAMPRTISNIDKWKGPNNTYISRTPIHVRASILYNKLIKEKNLENELPLITNGSTIRFSYMTLPNPLFENVFACPDEMPPDLNMDQYIDRHKQLQKNFINPIKALAALADIDLSDKVDISSFYEDDDTPLNTPVWEGIDVEWEIGQDNEEEEYVE